MKEHTDKPGPVELEEVLSLGWNSIGEHPQENAAVHAQQLYLVGRLLIELRDMLEPISKIAREKIDAEEAWAKLTEAGRAYLRDRDREQREGEG